MGDMVDITRSAAPGRCAVLSRSLDEPLPGTAPVHGGSWLAVEHAGPWPARGVDPALPPEARAVFARAAALGVRTQLIRRPGRRRSTPPPHTVLVASNRAPRPWLQEAALEDLGALAGLDLQAVADGRRPDFGTPAARPALLVCTNGRRDACCAEHGRPSALAMVEAHPGRVWETTHLSGDRFAANVACLPDGTYHGRVTRRTAPDVAAACLRGEVHLPHYRGRAGVPAAAQAAEHAVRLATGQTRVDAVTVERVERGGALVVLSAGGRRFAVPVRKVTAEPPRLMSCAGCTLSAPESYLAGSPYEPEPPGQTEPRGAH